MSLCGPKRVQICLWVGASVEPITLHVTHLISLDSKKRFTVVVPKNTTYIGLRVSACTCPSPPHLHVTHSLTSTASCIPGRMKMSFPPLAPNATMSTYHWRYSRSQCHACTCVWFLLPAFIVPCRAWGCAGQDCGVEWRGCRQRRPVHSVHRGPPPRHQD